MVKPLLPPAKLPAPLMITGVVGLVPLGVTLVNPSMLTLAQESTYSTLAVASLADSVYRLRMVVPIDWPLLLVVAVSLTHVLPVPGLSASRKLMVMLRQA